MPKTHVLAGSTIAVTVVWLSLPLLLAQRHTHLFNSCQLSANTPYSHPLSGHACAKRDGPLGSGNVLAPTREQSLLSIRPEFCSVSLGAA